MAKEGADDKYVYGFYMNSLMLNKKLFVPIIAGEDGRATTHGSTAGLLNKAALAEWEAILGDGLIVIGYTFNVPAPDAAHDSYPPASDASTWKMWFTWDALQCRTQGVPEIGNNRPKEDINDARGVTSSARVAEVAMVAVALAAW